MSSCYYLLIIIIPNRRKLLLAPRQHRITALVDHAVVHPATAEQLEEKKGEEEGEWKLDEKG